MASHTPSNFAQLAEATAEIIAQRDELLAALEALNLTCLADVLNPCLSGWSVGKPVQHWGSDSERIIPACRNCQARAAIQKARG